ncbi:histidine kinase [Agromyces sp. SYSU K20354]|uniref:sensor histidine kinase n=1 Tax=Agromyces cavernae TaxID=2898659 RepID=UPI001E5C3839|nr:histidine kinase [Agromyces cavernae]MCD2442035.1 histidine kinase [Agromyces cavernae]
MTTTPTRADLLIAAAAALTLLPLTAVVAFTSLTGLAAWVVMALALVAHLALPWRRSRPLTVLVVVAAAVGGQVAVTGLFFVLPSTLVFPIALYSAAAYGVATGANWPAIAVGLVGAAIAAGRYAADASVIGSGFGPSPWLLFLLFAAVVTCSWTMGRLRRAQVHATRVAEERAEGERREREQREALAAFEERARVSRDMHDILAHSLAVIIGQARVARFNESRRAPALTTIEETARNSLHEIRVMLRLLRDDATPRPQPTLAELPALIEQVRALGADVTYTTEGTPRPLGVPAQVSVYRFVQEALTNVTKHAHAGAAIDLSMRWSDDDLAVTVANDRVLGRPQAETIGPGMGLRGMSERLRAVDGTLTAEYTGHDGFTITARTPLHSGHAG